MFARFVLLISAVLILAGCAVPRVPFNDFEYKVNPHSGDKIVTGRLFLTDQLKQTQYGSGSEVRLEPVTSYSNQWFEVSYQNKRALAAPDKRYDQYVLITKADKQGNFSFENVPPGEYYLSGKVKWRAATCSGNVVYELITICQKISLDATTTKAEVILTKPFVSPTDICKLYNQGDWIKE